VKKNIEGMEIERALQELTRVMRIQWERWGTTGDNLGRHAARQREELVDAYLRLIAQMGLRAVLETLTQALVRTRDSEDALVERLRVAEERVAALEAILVDHVREGKVGNPIDLGDDEEEDIGKGIKKRKIIK